MHYSDKRDYRSSGYREHSRQQHEVTRPYNKGGMVASSVSRRRSASVNSSRSALRSGKYSGKEESSRYLENAVVAFEDFGEAQSVLKLYEFKDKARSSEKLKKNVVIKIEVSDEMNEFLEKVEVCWKDSF